MVESVGLDTFDTVRQRKATSDEDEEEDEDEAKGV